MNSVIIAAPHALHAEPALRRDLTLGVEAMSGGLGLVITDGETRAYLVREDGLMTDLEPDERQAVLDVIPAPVFYSLSWSDLRLCHRVLFLIADDPALLVDNDHGFMASGDEFLRRLRANPDWDWRAREGRGAPTR